MRFSHREWCIAAAIGIIALTMYREAAAMDAPEDEFGGRDLIATGFFQGPPKSQKGTRNRRFKGSTGGDGEAFLVAVSLRAGGLHPATPSLTVDVLPEGGSCGPYDYLFIPRCGGPDTDVKILHEMRNRLSHSYLYVFRLPNRWTNLRITLPHVYGCGNNGQHARTSAMKIANPSMVCMRALFKKRSCKRRFIFGKKCRIRDCSDLHMSLMSRLISFKNGDITTAPYITTGGGFNICKNSEVFNLFKK